MDSDKVEIDSNTQPIKENILGYQWEFKRNHYTVNPLQTLIDRYRILLKQSYDPMSFNEFISSLYSVPGKRQGNWKYENTKMIH